MSTRCGAARRGKVRYDAVRRGVPTQATPQRPIVFVYWYFVCIHMTERGRGCKHTTPPVVSRCALPLSVSFFPILPLSFFFFPPPRPPTPPAFLFLSLPPTLFFFSLSSSLSPSRSPAPPLPPPISLPLPALFRFYLQAFLVRKVRLHCFLDTGAAAQVQPSATASSRVNPVLLLKNTNNKTKTRNTKQYRIIAA